MVDEKFPTDGESSEKALTDVEGSSSSNSQDIDCSQNLEENGKKKNKPGIFYAISIGNATGQSFLFNFFSAFAVLMGVGPNLLGFVTSIRNLMSSLFQGTIGRLSDKYGRRFFLLGGFSLVFASFLILLFINDTTMVPLTRIIVLIVVSIIQAFSLSIIIPVWSAALGDVTVSEKRARYIGRLSAVGTAISVTLMLSLSVSFWLINEKFTNWYIGGKLVYIEERVQYLIAFGFAAANFVLCIIGSAILKETKKAVEIREQPSMFLALKNKTFKRFFIINTIYGLIMSLMWPIFPIAQMDESLLNMTFSQLAITNAIFSISSSLALFFGGKLGDKIGRKPLIIYGRMAMFVIPTVMICAVYFDNWLILIVSNFIGGSAIGAITVGQNAYILDIAPEEQMGAYTGLAQVGWGIATFVGSLSAGFIANAISKAYGVKIMIYSTFITIAILRLVSSTFFFLIKESLTKEKREKMKLQEEAEKEAKYAYVSACEDSTDQTK
ncbi:MAG: MFS transporter [Asgard group archaeon]|nr:MFS transporter [Asgard group archaeon]